jgi:hypothetical protein
VERKSGLAVPFALALVMGWPHWAKAQAQTDGDDGATNDHSSELSGTVELSGFQLLEHGIWRRSAEPSLPVSIFADTDQLSAPVHKAPESRGRPASFRRAIYLPHIYAAEARYALPSGLLDALVWTESRYNPAAVSPAGAAGLGQLMPGTASDLRVANRFDPVANINGAARYLRQMLDKFGVVHLALAAYNAGPGTVERAGGIPRNRETPAYVRNVLRRWRSFIGNE